MSMMFETPKLLQILMITFTFESCLAPAPDSTPQFRSQQYRDEHTESEECMERVLQTWSKSLFPGKILFPNVSRR